VSSLPGQAPCCAHRFLQEDSYCQLLPTANEHQARRASIYHLLMVSQEVAATSDQEAASFDIEETLDETESDEEPTTEDDRGIDDSAVPDAETRDLYRRMEMEEATARLEEDETPDDALALMRREMQRRRARDEAPATSM
jgi:hypothetical protein